MDARALPPKYITVNGVMKLNPDYAAAKAKQGAPTTVANPTQALAIISTADEMMAASDMMSKDKTVHKPIEMSTSNTDSIAIIQDEDFLNKFKAPKGIDGGDLLDKLYNEFAKYEVPLGLINKLLILAERKLKFIMDNSGSMSAATDVKFKQATPYIQKQMRASQTLESHLSRWQEAQDRMHILIDLIGFIPTNGITIRYLNAPTAAYQPLVLNQTGQNPEDFIANAHKQITEFFTKPLISSTPIKTALTEAFAETNEQSIHYLFTDGEPTDGTIAEVTKLIKERKNPKNNALTLISCSDEDTKWMKEVEEEAEYVAELDDYQSECKEVAGDQGPAFPYSKGIWLICNLVAALCPYDLDAIDESTPFSKFTLGNILGRKLNEQEYGHYFNLNPNKKIWSALYSTLSSEKEEVVAVSLAEKVREMHKLKRDDKIEESHVNAYAAKNGMKSSFVSAPPSYAESQSMFAQNGQPAYSQAQEYKAPASSFTR